MSQSDNTTKIVGIAGTALMGLMGNFFYDKVIADKEPTVAPTPQVQVVFVPQPNNTVVAPPSPTTDDTAQFVSVNANIPQTADMQSVPTEVISTEEISEPKVEQEYKLIEPSPKASAPQKQAILNQAKVQASDAQSTTKIAKPKTRELDPIAVRVLNVAYQIEGDTVKVDWRATNKSGIPLGKQQFKAVFYDGINSSGQIIGEYASREYEKPLGPCGTLPYKERFQAPPNMKSIQIQTVNIQPLVVGQTDPVQHCY